MNILMGTDGMIRSRRKIETVIHNEQCFQKIREESAFFSEYIWGFTNGKTYFYMGNQKVIFRQETVCLTGSASI